MPKKKGKKNAGKTYRILILEDNAADAGLMEFELTEAKIPYVSKTVVNEEDYIKALHEFCPDLILADYDLPQYDGSIALFWTKAICSSTPFILVSGNIDETMAREIMREGAADYVMKDRLDKLAPTVKRTLNIAG